MRITNGNQKILVLQQKHTYLDCVWSPPHREERKPFSTLKSERRTALSRAKCFRDEGNVWNIPHQLSQCSQFPTCTMPTAAGLSRLPALLFLCAQEDDGFMMQMKVDWKPLHRSCSWPPAPLFAPLRPGISLMENVFVFTMAALGDYDKAPASLQQRSPV